MTAPKKAARHYCPSCGASLVTDLIGTSLRCARCSWHLITRAEWTEMSPFLQGYARYMQGSWPTSELADAKNPYAEGTSEWKKFRHGEQSAVRDAQDGEE